MKVEKMKVAVLAGGISRERDVSLRSGAAVAKALRSVGVKVLEVDVKERGVKVPQGTDICFLCLHGTYGEDGEVQAELEAAQMPFTGSGSVASALAFDKLKAKEAMIAAGVPMAESMEWSPENDWKAPYVCKPVADGSSFGVFLVREEADIAPTRKSVGKWKGAMMIERLVVGTEMTVGILGEKALPVVEIRPGKGFYDTKNKYTAGATQYLCPAPIPKEKAEELQTISLNAHRALGCEVLSRVDLILDQEGKATVLEVNTLPGMTDLSLLPKAGRTAGIDFASLCLKILELSWERTKRGVVK
jgi:D-alanine-D-alanine ligase